MNTDVRESIIELKNSLILYKDVAIDLFKWYNNEKTVKLDTNKLFSYDIFIILGLIESYLYAKNIILVFTGYHLLVRYSSSKGDKHHIDPILSKLPDSMEDDLEIFITLVPIHKNYVVTKVKGIIETIKLLNYKLSDLPF